MTAVGSITFGPRGYPPVRDPKGNMMMAKPTIGGMVLERGNTVKVRGLPNAPRMVVIFVRESDLPAVQVMWFDKHDQIHVQDMLVDILELAGL